MDKIVSDAISRVEKITFDRSDLERFGIKFLTGEACALSMRLLCELDERAMRTYMEFVGFSIMSPGEILREYNCFNNNPTFDPIGSIDKSHYNDLDKYSVYLVQETVRYLIILMLLQEHEAVKVLHIAGSDRIELLAGSFNDIQTRLDHFPDVYGYFDKDKGEYGEYIPGEFYTTGRWYRVNTNPHRGFSNVHAMTGQSK